MHSQVKRTQLYTVGGHKLDHLAINSTTAVAGGVTRASAATAVVEFMAMWLNLSPPTIHFTYCFHGFLNGHVWCVCLEFSVQLL